MLNKYDFEGGSREVPTFLFACNEYICTTMAELVSYIYSLSYPAGNVRYIGKTNDVKSRYHKHLRDAKYSTNSRRLAWIRSLLNQNCKPILDVIDVVPECEWAFWEKHYISLYRSWGFDLTNSTAGGEGLLATEEVKRKISESCKEHWRTHTHWATGTKGVVKGRPKGYKLSKEMVERQCEVFRNYYLTHEIWNKNKCFRTPELNHKEKPMRDPKNRVVQLDLNGNFVKEWG